MTASDDESMPPLINREDGDSSDDDSIPSLHNQEDDNDDDSTTNQAEDTDSDSSSCTSISSAGYARLRHRANTRLYEARAWRFDLSLLPPVPGGHFMYSLRQGDHTRRTVPPSPPSLSSSSSVTSVDTDSAHT